MLYNIKIGVIKKMNDADKSATDKTEEGCEEPPPKSNCEEVSQDVRSGCLDSLLLESYVLCRRDFVGQRRLAVLAMHDDNNVFNNCNVGDWLVRNIFNFKK